MKEKSLDEKISNESLRIGTVSVDDKVAWTTDEMINGLYSVDKLTLEVKNILDPSQIFKYGRFRIISIFQWKCNVILVPSELDKKWIIYNKEQKKVEYKDIVHLRGKTSGIYISGKRGILIPASSIDPIVIIDLETMERAEIIEKWDSKIIEKNRKKLGTGTGIIVNEKVYFYLYDTKNVIKINQNTVDVYRLHIPNGICSMDYSDDKLWILPTKGCYIYGIDKKGVVEKINLFRNRKLFSASDFIRIVTAGKYIFLLPISKKEIVAYEVQKDKVYFINTEGNNLQNIFPIRVPTTAYWGYYIEGNILYILPLENKLLEVNLNTMKCNSKEVYLPSFISGRGLKYWIEWNQWFIPYTKNKELNEKSIEIYCNILKMNDTKCKTSYRNVGNIIWRKIKP